MASRRMLSLAEVDSDKFLQLNLSAQSLYFHLSLRADDDGFVDNLNSIKRMVGSKDSDVIELLEKDYLIVFNDSLCLITNWHRHNTIRKDRYTKTVYQNEIKLVKLEENIYSLRDKNIVIETKWQPSGNQVVTNGMHRVVESSIGKSSIGEYRIGEKGKGKQLEKEKTATAAEKDIFTSLLTNTGEEYQLNIQTVDKYKALYQNVDVENEIIKMKGWLFSNPTKRKTKTGMLRFINGWLTKEQDKNYGKVIINNQTGEVIENIKEEVKKEDIDKEQEQAIIELEKLKKLRKERNYNNE